jgi:YVTN family beta-propeller protein
VAVNPNGTHAYIANVDSNTLSVFDTSNNEIVATVPVGSSPLGVAVNSNGTRAYVANLASNTVSVIDTTNNQVVGTVPVGPSPFSLGAFIGSVPCATPTPTATATPTPTPTPAIHVTVQTNPAGRAFTVDGSIYSTTHTFSWVPGSSHIIATTSPQNAGAGVRYLWTRWSDNGAISHSVAPTTNKTYTAIFTTQYLLTMSHGTGGNVSPTSGWRNRGATLSITATPATGYHFINWTGTGIGSYSGANNPASITMSGPITERAIFAHN